jgi:hypothetical protein
LLNKPWFVAALGLSAILLVLIQLWPELGSRFGRGPAVADVDAAVDPSSAGPAADAPSASSAVEAALAELPAPANSRDPFAGRPGALTKLDPGTAAAPAKDSVATFHLSALWTEHESTLALINGRICQLGDTVGRLRVAAANQDGVWVTHGADRDFIPLGGDFTLHSSAAPAATAVTLN